VGHWVRFGDWGRSDKKKKMKNGEHCKNGKGKVNDLPLEIMDDEGGGTLHRNHRSNIKPL